MKWRVSVLSFIVIIFSILGMGVIGELGDYITYPAQSGINLTKYEGNLKKEQIYDKLEKISKENNLILFKPILQPDGSEKAFIFGDAQKYLKDSMYSDDKKILADTEITGMYYINRGLSKDLKKELKMMGFQYKGGDIGWYMSPMAFFFGKNVRSIAVWTLMFVFASLLFAVKMMYLKTAMVRRSLGIFRGAILKETMIDVGILILDSIFMIGVFSLWQGSMHSVFVKSFSLLVSVTLLCLVIISLITNGLFALNIRLMSATTVLKNKKSQGLISYIWLFGILISVFIFEITASEIIHISKELAKDAGTLQNWNVAKDLATIEWFDVEREHTEGHQIDGQFMIENGAKNKNFIQSFGKEDWLYSKASALWDAHGRMERQLADPYYVQRLNEFGIDAKDVKLAEYIQYVNPGMIEKNKKIYPNNNYGKLSATEKS
ncbi:MAG: hypothetical protein LBT69_00760 [Lactobacillales bacterium]|jgi:hypothetical protein|nr:hypothetical protein [Lactobacillales bacterium]